MRALLAVAVSLGVVVHGGRAARARSPRPARGRRPPRLAPRLVPGRVAVHRKPSNSSRPPATRATRSTPRSAHCARGCRGCRAGGVRQARGVPRTSARAGRRPSPSALSGDQGRDRRGPRPDAGRRVVEGGARRGREARRRGLGEPGARRDWAWWRSSRATSAAQWSALGSALKVAQSNGDVSSLVRWLTLFGHGYVQLDRPKEALDFYDRALKAAATVPELQFPAMTHVGRSNALIKLGRIAEADEHPGQATELRRRSTTRRATRRSCWRSVPPSR